MPLTTEQRDWLRLIMVPGVGSTHFIRLLARFHTPANVFEASTGDLKEIVGQMLAHRIAQYAGEADTAAQERLMDACGATLVTLEDAAYPVRLAEIYDPPLALFVRGTLIEADTYCVAIVGTRRATPYGIRMAEKLGRDLAARGITVVSGMASGIDAAAHRGAIEAGGRTIAVLGNGVDVVYPPQHDELMRQIAQHGCAVSQFEMGVKPSKGHFPYRNRIISGMSLGTIVVEAPRDSGALITARQAAEQGREVFAVPGQVGVANSQGPHLLIREGAKLVETVDDILVELDVPPALRGTDVKTPAPAKDSFETPPLPAPSARPAMAASSSDVPASPKPAPAILAAAPPDSPIQKDILSVLAPEGSFVDEIAAACRISISEALSNLTLLELRGRVRQFSGKRFTRM